MSLSYVWHVLFIYVPYFFICETFLLDICDTTHTGTLCRAACAHSAWAAHVKPHGRLSCVGSWRIHMCDMTHSYLWHAHVWHDSFMYETFVCVTWLFHSHVRHALWFVWVLRSRRFVSVWHDSFICETSPSHKWQGRMGTRWFVSVWVCECIASNIHMYDTMHGRLACVGSWVYYMTHSYVRRDSFIHETYWVISAIRRMGACVGSWVYHIAHSYVWHDVWAPHLRQFVSVSHGSSICETWLSHE